MVGFLRKKKLLIPLALFLLIIGRWLLQIMLYRAGFEALTADEFSRTVLAARWAKEPYMVWSGAWLPFPLYFHGIALSLWWDLLDVPRAITMGIGFISFVVMYQLGYQLFESRKVGFLSATLLAVNPVHIWLSSTPLTELPQFTITLAAILAIVLYLKYDAIGYAYTGALLMGLANGFRFEAWMMSIVFSLYFISHSLPCYQASDKKDAYILTLIAVLPWIFPVIWIISNYWETGDPLYFKTFSTFHKITYYGNNHAYAYYWETFLKIDPYTSLLFVFSFIASIATNYRISAVKWYLAMATIPFFIFAYMHGGQLEPLGNFLRYLAPFLFLTYPAVAFLFVSGTQKIFNLQPLQNGSLILVITLIAVTQINTTFGFTNDPTARGLRAGKRIAELRQSEPKLAQRPVLIELVYWHYLAIHVGANDVSLILYDRMLDLEERKTKSMLLSNADRVSSCLHQYDISYIIIKSPELIDYVENELGLRTTESVHEWRFYPVPPSVGENKGTCTLSFGKARSPQ